MRARYESLSWARMSLMLKGLCCLCCCRPFVFFSMGNVVICIFMYTPPVRVYVCVWAGERVGGTLARSGNVPWRALSQWRAPLGRLSTSDCRSSRMAPVFKDHAVIGCNNIIYLFFNVAAHIAFKNAYIRILISNFSQLSKLIALILYFSYLLFFYAKHTYAYTHIASSSYMLTLSLLYYYYRYIFKVSWNVSSYIVLVRTFLKYKSIFF